MMQLLVEYVKAEGNCTTEKAEEIAWNIMDAVDEMIHDRLEEDDDDN